MFIQHIINIVFILHDIIFSDTKPYRTQCTILNHVYHKTFEEKILQIHISSIVGHKVEIQIKHCL